MNPNSVVRQLIGAVAVLGSLAIGPAFAQGSSVIVGTVTDASNQQPVADVVVTATSPNLQGEQVVVTDNTGAYRIPQLPPGDYSLRFEKESFRPFNRAEITIRIDRTVRVNVELLPDSLQADTIVVVGRSPVVDVGSTTTGMNIGSDFVKNIATVRPVGRNAGARSFESLAEIAPGAQADTYGVSISGTTSPENQYVIDGVSVNDPGFGLNGSPLSVEFIREVNVISGGYLPEFGRATGGVVNVVTKSGSNEFHGSVYGSWTPGFLEAEGLGISVLGNTVRGISVLDNIGDVGAEIGGPIMKDKLWFYAGFQPSVTRYKTTRSLFALNLAADGSEAGDPIEVAGNTRDFFGDQKSFQFIGKLTYLVNQDNSFTLSVSGAPTASGGNGNLPISSRTGGVAQVLNGVPDRFTSVTNFANSLDVSAKYSSAFMDKRLLLDATFGWHHQDNGTRPSDGSEMGSNTGLAGLAGVLWERQVPHPHSITEFETITDTAGLCNNFDYDSDGNGSLDSTAVPCPVVDYSSGGPGFIAEANLNRYQATLVGTYLLNILGHHVVKAGLDFEHISYANKKAYTGLRFFQEEPDGFAFSDSRMFGYLTGPDQPVIQNLYQATSTGNTIGGFIQDSWSLLDLVTVNAGIRYDHQVLVGGDNKTALVLPNQWSPRLGLIYDFTRQGRSKIFANFATYYESVPLNLVDRQFPGEKQLFVYHVADDVNNFGEPGGCDPRTNEGQEADGCTGHLYPLNAGSRNANRFWIPTGADPTPVDPTLEPQSSSEIVAGAEYEVVPNGSVGLSYTKRWMNKVIEDMSFDEGATYFIGNPGYGFADTVTFGFPKAVRDYDAVSLYFTKAFTDLWLAQVTYTYANLRGNFAGLFRPESGQLDPNINSTFDIISLLPNQDGPLPGDRRHSVKVFGAKEFMLGSAMSLNLGLSYRGRSGLPINVLGAHPLYGGGEAYVLPRGAGGRLPWTHQIDARLGFNYKLNKDSIVTLSMDVFNLFNFQETTRVDEEYTFAPILPLVGGSLSDLPGTNDPRNPDLLAPNLSPYDPANNNDNFLQPTQYQTPRQFRFAAKVTF